MNSKDMNDAWVRAWGNATIEERKSVRRWDFRPELLLMKNPRLIHRNCLKGDRNQCAGCGEFFNSSSSFDAHRTGSFGNNHSLRANRRCLTVEEMQEKGMLRNDKFYWIEKSNTLYSHNTAI